MRIPKAVSKPHERDADGDTAPDDEEVGLSSKAKLSIVLGAGGAIFAILLAVLIAVLASRPGTPVTVQPPNEQPIRIAEQQHPLPKENLIPKPVQNELPPPPIIIQRPEPKPPQPAAPTWIEPPLGMLHDKQFVTVRAVALSRVTLHVPSFVKYVGDARIQEATPGDPKSLSASKYLVIHLDLAVQNVIFEKDGNIKIAEGKPQWLYYHPNPAQIKLADELGNAFAPVMDVQVAKEVVPAAGSPLPRDKSFILGQRQAALLQHGYQSLDKASDLLLFSPENLGKGKELKLELPGSTVGNFLPFRPISGDPPPQIIRFRLSQANLVFQPPEVNTEKITAAGLIPLLNRLGSQKTGDRYLAAKGVSALSTKLTGTADWQEAAIILGRQLPMEAEDEVRFAFAEALVRIRAKAFALTKNRKGFVGIAPTIFNYANRAIQNAKHDPSPKVLAIIGGSKSGPKR